MPFLALDGDDARLELRRQLIGEPHRPSRSVAESLKPVLFVPVEDLVSGFAGNAEVPAHLGHRFAVQEAGDKSQAFVHHRTLFPRHPHPPQKSGKCNPCVRYGMSPMSRAAHMYGPEWVSADAAWGGTAPAHGARRNERPRLPRG